MDIISKLRHKFTSANSVPIERTTITREEFEKKVKDWLVSTSILLFPVGLAIVMYLIATN